MPNALVTGVTGQDGWYLSEILQDAGYDVFGLVSAGDSQPVPEGVRTIVGDMRDQDSLVAAVDASQADVVYNLASISSVGASWNDPVAVTDVNSLGVARLLMVVRDCGRPLRVVHAGSAEIFGDAAAPQSETTPIAPTNPYGAAKALGQHLAYAFRAEGLWVATAILFPHESPRRPSRFVTRKITLAAAAIARGTEETLTLGNLDARRDWGFAGDYARAMYLIAQQDDPDDFVVATGQSHTVGDFVAAAFTAAGVPDWRDRVSSDEQFVRPTDSAELRGDSRRLRSRTGWSPSIDFDELVASMVEHDQRTLAAGDSVSR